MLLWNWDWLVEIEVRYINVWIISKGVYYTDRKIKADGDLEMASL